MTLFDTTSKDIIIISYPSGGFGNFLYHVLTNHASDTVKVDNNYFFFNKNGNSHDTKKYTNVYFHDPIYYNPSIDNVITKNKKILVLCDNGILNDTYDKLRQVFPNATIVRSTISQSVRPIIYKTCIVKAMQTNVIDDTKTHVVSNWNDSGEDYAIRENFTLMYHNWPFSLWEEDHQCINVNLENLITEPHNAINSLIFKLEMKVVDQVNLQKLIDDWRDINSKYFKIYYECKKIENALNENYNLNLEHLTDLHDQGYINYWIEQKHHIIIPVYNYKNWFVDTYALQKAINEIKHTHYK
jgi:hypothetical protein